MSKTTTKYQRLFIAGLLSVVTLFMLTACGFHLRGAFQLPEEMATVYLQAKNANSELLLDIKRTLKTNGSVVVDDATKATASLKIKTEKQTQRVISVDNNGRASEYELKFEVVYSLSTISTTEKNTIRIKDRKLELIRDYLYDSTAVLGSSREKAALIRDMQRDAARLMMLQIQAAYRKSQRTDMDSKSSAPVKLEP